jgi:hypothetical protein
MNYTMEIFRYFHEKHTKSNMAKTMQTDETIGTE